MERRLAAALAAAGHEVSAAGTTGTRFGAVPQDVAGRTAALGGAGTPATDRAPRSFASATAVPSRQEQPPASPGADTPTAATRDGRSAEPAKDADAASGPGGSSGGRAGVSSIPDAGSEGAVDADAEQIGGYDDASAGAGGGYSSDESFENAVPVARGTGEPPEIPGAGGDPSPGKAPSPADTAEKPSPLPALDTLLPRVPGELKELMEDLFRAKFVGVRRVDPRAIKTEKPAVPPPA